MSTHVPRIAELNELARSEGIRLPLPAHLIVKLEDDGHIVDLNRCVVQMSEADRPIPEWMAKALRGGQ